VGYYGYHFWFMQPYPKSLEKCVYALAATRKRHVASERLLQTRSTFTKLITVSMGVLKLVWNRHDFYQCSMMHTAMRCS